MQMQKIFRKNIGIIMTAAIMTILVINFITTAYSLQKQQLETFNMKIDQVIHTMENNQIELVSIKANLDEDYLTRAKAAAYVIEKNPEILGNVQELKNLAALLDVDEVHVIDGEGIITDSSVPQYIGLDFHDGEQTRGFLPILESADENAYIIQEAQPNAAEGKIMKYVGVARLGEPGIVQVGLEPVRQMEAQMRNTYNYIFARFPTEEGEEYFAVDCNEDEVIGYSDGMYKSFGECYRLENLLDCSEGAFKTMENGSVNYVVTRQYGDVLIGAAIPRSVLFQSLWKNTFMTCLYLLIIALVVISLLNYLVKRKVVQGIHNVLDDLSEITNGNLDTTVSVGGNREFEQLSEGINTMVKSIVNTTDRISKIIEMSGVSLATFEHQSGMQRVFVTSGLAELLNLSEKEGAKLYKDAALFYNRIEEIMKSPIEGERDVYKMGEDRYVRIHLSKDDDSYLGVVTDVSAEIFDKQRMQYENNHDQLTGLCRYQYFKQQAAERLEKMPEGEIAVSVMLDMDDFKSINDTFGHDMGDKYLKAFAGLLEELPKEHCIPARRSGDEFCMFLFGYKEREEAISLLHSFWEKLQQNPVEISKGQQRGIGISGGFAIAEDVREDITELLHHADEALYQAKETNKGSFAEYYEQEIKIYD